MSKFAGIAKAVGFSALLFLSAQPAMAGDTEDQVRNYCIATGQTSTWAFASCMTQNLGVIELNKIPEDDFFGEENTIRKTFERPNEAIEDLGRSVGRIFGW